METIWKHDIEFPFIARYPSNDEVVVEGCAEAKLMHMHTYKCVNSSHLKNI